MKERIMLAFSLVLIGTFVMPCFIASMENQQIQLQPTFYQKSMMWMPTATGIMNTGKNAARYLVPMALPMLAEAVVPWPGGEAPVYSSTEMFETEKYVFFGPLCVGTAFVCAIGLAVCIDKCNKRTTTPVFTKAQKKRIRRNNKQLAKALEHNAQPRAGASTF
jgi:hypothetical protein